ncbi:MAG: hypothetical protein H6760_00425 [Candidatus Nomurabacteria bacterium]|nr:MAG: hypothetical protein H6760_00425 [Candidatus Nomurabacteria bacterium]
MPEVSMREEGGSRKLLIATVAILCVLLVGVLIYTHPWSPQQGLTETEVSDMIREFADQMPAPVAEIPDDVVRKGDLASMQPAAITLSAFDETYLDTLWATVKDPVTGKIDSTMVVKTRTRNPITDLQKDVKSTNAEARAAKVAARNAEKRLKETPTQFAVTVPSTSTSTSLHQPGGVQLGGTTTTTAPVQMTTRTSTQAGLVAGTIGGGSPPPPPASNVAVSMTTTMVPAGEQVMGGDGLMKQGPAVAFVYNGQTYVRRDLVQRNKYGDPINPSRADQNFYVMAGEQGMNWKLVNPAKQKMTVQGDYLVWPGVIKGPFQVGWVDPNDPAYMPESGVVWAPIAEFYSGYDGTFCRDPDYQLRAVAIQQMP